MRRDNAPVCIVGLGPAGLGAALQYARSADARDVLCLEAGVSADLKYCSILEGKGCRFVQPCQVITGVGGSSLLSAGKISGFPAGRALADILGGTMETDESLQRALAAFEYYVPLIPACADDALVHATADHYMRHGFDFRYYKAQLYRQRDLVTGYGRMLADIRHAGVTVSLGTEVTDIVPSNDGFRLYGSVGGREAQWDVAHLILAVGRFGSSLLAAINPSLGLAAQPNWCDVGVRLEFPRHLWPDLNACHNDLKLHFMNARTFCVCTGGYLAPYRIGDMFLLEGSSDPDRASEWSNLAITVRVPPSARRTERAILAEVQELLHAQTGGKPMRQHLSDYLAQDAPPLMSRRESASIPYWRWGNVNACFPADIACTVREAVAYFVERVFPAGAYPAISVFAPELDYYWPRFPIDHGFQSRRAGLYLIGDCGGQFRGILQAFCSGLECARHLLGDDHAP